VPPKQAAKKVNNVLKEILAGNASDPCGMVFYSQQLTAKGEPAYDSHDHAILDCSHGSNDTECAHKQFITTFGTWNTGVEMSDVLIWQNGAIDIQSACFKAEEAGVSTDRTTYMAY